MTNHLSSPTRLGSKPVDRTSLKDLLTPLRPTVTTYLPARSDVADPLSTFKLHWSNLRRTLGAAGALDTDLDALDAVSGQPQGQSSRTCRIIRHRCR